MSTLSELTIEAEKLAEQSSQLAQKIAATETISQTGGADPFVFAISIFVDLSYSNYLVKIPTSSKFKSLNLSHSISIISYEVFKLLGKKKFKKEPVKSKKAKKKDLIAFLNLLKKLLEKRNFFKPIEKKNSMITNINNLFYRFEPNDKEIRILASIISSLSKKNHKA